MARGSIDLGIISKFDNKGVSKAQRAFKKFGGVAAGVATATVAAIATIGTAATRMASEFETSFAQIEGLVGVSKGQLGELEEAARTLGPQFGKSANEAAEALFFITSAGLRGESAINVLEASLKGAAIGLGDTKTIADLATSAVNAYGESNLDGAQAVDVLTEAVRLGKLEPAELAGAMGQVLPLASNLGVSFDQVGAAMAGMSKTGTDASTAATQLRQILATIAKPTAEAERSLAGMGLSAEGLREQIREEGLYNTLETLTDAFDGNIEATSAVFGNIRALSGVLDLMGASAEDNREVFRQMSDEVGVLDDALGVTEETGAFKFARAMETLQAQLLPVGDLLLEIGGDLLDSLMPVIEQVGPMLVTLFENMRPMLQDFAAQLPGLLEALMPVVLFLGDLATTMGELVVATMPVFTGLLQLITPLLQLLSPVLDIVVGLFQMLMHPIEFLIAMLTPLVETILWPITEGFGLLADAVGFFADVLAPINDVLIPHLTEYFNDTFGPALDVVKDKMGDMVDNGFQYLIDSGILPVGFSLDELRNQTPQIMAQFANFIIKSFNFVIAAANEVINVFAGIYNQIVAAGKALGRFKDVAYIQPDVIPPIPEVTAADFISVEAAAQFSEKDIGPLAAGFVQAQENAAALAEVQRLIRGDTTGYSSSPGRREGIRGDYVDAAFADGGIVTGPMVGLVGEAGPEAIIPLDRFNGGGPTYNITVQAGVGDPVRIGEEVVTAIKRYERVSGPVFASA